MSGSQELSGKDTTMQGENYQNQQVTSAPQKEAPSTLKVLVQAFLIALVIRTFFFQPFSIPSGSMIPTLEIGDYLFVSKYSYGYSSYTFPYLPPLFSGRYFGNAPQRGDIAVFKLPSDGSTDYIKRVIGLPGDQIRLEKGRVYINGTLVPREPAPSVRTKDRFKNEVEVPTYIETLPGGVSHKIIQIEDDKGFYDTTGVYTVPAGHYFMMGDNRDNSTDSRVPKDQGGVGFVPLENFVGRAEVTFFSVREGHAAYEVWAWPTSVRWDRIFQLTR